MRAACAFLLSLVLVSPVRAQAQRDPFNSMKEQTAQLVRQYAACVHRSAAKQLADSPGSYDFDLLAEVAFADCQTEEQANYYWQALFGHLKSAEPDANLAGPPH
jgi:hypothetical protein